MRNSLKCTIYNINLEIESNNTHKLHYEEDDNY